MKADGFYWKLYEHDANLAIQLSYFLIHCWESIYVVVSGYDLDDSGSTHSRGRDLSYAIATRLALGPTHSLIQRVP